MEDSGHVEFDTPIPSILPKNIIVTFPKASNRLPYCTVKDILKYL